MMPLHRNQLYVIILTACAVGYVWLYFHLTDHFKVVHSVCLVKQVTDIPCPSCGTTRAILALIHGEWLRALLTNPFGFAVSLMVLFAPLWVAIDLMMRKQTLFNCYRKMEERLKQTLYALPLIVLVLINWVWNICKGL